MQRFARAVAEVLGVVPFAIAAAFLAIVGIAITTLKVETTWLKLLLAVCQATAWPVAVATVWLHERSDLGAYERSEAIAPSELAAEFREAEDYDDRWRADERLRERAGDS